MDFESMTVAELLKLHGQTLAELRRRKVVRTTNAPAGDLAQWLVREATGGKLADNKQKSWQVLAPEGRLTVKARLVSDTRNRSQRQVSPFRTWDFDAAVFVLFDENYVIRRVACLPVAEVQATARWSRRVNGHIVFATDRLLKRGDDWAARLHGVIERVVKPSDAIPATSPWRTERRDGPTANGGAYSITVIDDTGRIREVTEYTADGNIVTRDVRPVS